VEHREVADALREPRAIDRESGQELAVERAEQRAALIDDRAPRRAAA
jgi:hypothetical protein